MIQLQVLNKILATCDDSIIQLNGLTKDYFVGYEDEYEFIQNHIIEYGNVPDKETFLSKFPDFDLVEVTESDKYLLDTIREEYLYYQSVPILQKAAELLKFDSIAAAEYMIQSLRNVQLVSTEGTDLAESGIDRYELYKERVAYQNNFFFTSGFPELDNLMDGINRDGELFVIFARTNQGKSWVLEKICANIWELGYNVGYVSPELSVTNIGYRFDTLVGKFSNKALTKGQKINKKAYRKYLKSLKKNEAKFIIASPADFNRQMTVSKLRSFIIANDLQALAVDGVTYIDDERYRRGDSKNISLTNIAEDLRGVTLELGVPILIVVQANRTGVITDDSGVPELESIRDSDGISHNATKVLSIRQKDGELIMEIKKNTYGMVGGRVKYRWDIDVGDFTFIEGDEVGKQGRKKRSKQDDEDLEKVF